MMSDRCAVVLSALQNPAIDFASVGYTHDVNNNFRHVYLVYDSVVTDSNPISVFSASQPSCAHRNRLVGEAVNRRFCPVTNL